MAEPITVEFLRELYTRAWLSPSEEELRALVPVVQGFYDGAPQVEEILAREDEPAVTFALPVQP
jgi:hypothetical protein